MKEEEKGKYLFKDGSINQFSDHRAGSESLGIDRGKERETRPDNSLEGDNVPLSLPESPVGRRLIV
jgi:hypothetical protein